MSDIVPDALRGKRALVGGSSQGIGRACAEALAAQGANVTLLARRTDVLQQVQASLATHLEQTHSYVSVDSGAPEQTRDRVAAHFEQHGPCEILINNTGGPAPGPLAEADVAELRAAFEAHVVCSHLLAQLCLPHMRAAGYGRIINIISLSVKEPIPGLGVSNTIRAAVANWAKTLADELGPAGVTVNNVLPGYIDTPRLRSLFDDVAARQSCPADNSSRRAVRPARAGPAIRRAGGTRRRGGLPRLAPSRLRHWYQRPRRRRPLRKSVDQLRFCRRAAGL